jgi:hypothetical protein
VRQGNTAQDRMARLERELLRHRQLFASPNPLSLQVWLTGRDYERESYLNPTFRERVKAIERLALRYAPLQGPEAEHLFEEIEWAKDVLDGLTPPPKPRRSKRKKKE